MFTLLIVFLMFLGWVLTGMILGIITAYYKSKRCGDSYTVNDLLTDASWGPLTGFVGIAYYMYRLHNKCMNTYIFKPDQFYKRFKKIDENV